MRIKEENKQVFEYFDIKLNNLPKKKRKKEEFYFF